MKIELVREIARSQQLSPGRLAKADLIRTIQRNEGNFDCFATAGDGYCDQTACMWREDCLGTKSRH